MELEGARYLFEAYSKAVGGTAYNGEAIPGWFAIQERARIGWVAVYIAAKAMGDKDQVIGVIDF